MATLTSNRAKRNFPTSNAGYGILSTGYAVLSTAGNVANTLVQPTPLGTVAGAAHGVAESYVTSMCVAGLMESISPDLVAYAPILQIMFSMIGDIPKSTGNDNTDEQAWYAHVDSNIGKLEGASEKPIESFFQDQGLIDNLSTFTGQDMNFLKDREAIFNMLYDSPGFSGVVEQYLSDPIEKFADHSITITDRFDNYLPDWIIKKLGVNPGLRIVGDVNRQPALNLKSIKIIGFTTYEPKGPQLGKDHLKINPMERFNGLPKGIDKYGDEYQYNYFGPNNPLPHGEAINDLDEYAKIHDYAYLKHGYNTPGAREADRVMVNSMKEALKNGKIKEDSPQDQYPLAQKAILYFGLIDVK